jgi:stage IV sporulation protein FB
MPDRPVQELVIAAAGPLVNFVIAAILLPFMFLVVGMQMRAGTIPADWSLVWSAVQTPGAGNLLLWLVATNLLLGVFNLLPAFPMDGGRILRSLLAMAMPYVRATRIAVLVGRIMAVLLAVWGLFLWSSQGTGIIMLLIAFFVYVGGTAEREAVESRAVLKKVLAGRALTPSAVYLYTSETLSRAMDLLMTSYQTDYPEMDLSGHYVGVLTRARLIGALKQQGPDARIVDAMLKADDVPVYAPDANLAEIWDKMVERSVRVVSIQEQADFLGLITIDDITEVFHLLRAANEDDLSGDNDSLGTKERGKAVDV